LTLQLRFFCTLQPSCSPAPHIGFAVAVVVVVVVAVVVVVGSGVHAVYMLYATLAWLSTGAPSALVWHSRHHPPGAQENRFLFSASACALH
jgi:hypothetical protein